MRDAFLTVASKVEQQTKTKVDIKSVPWPPTSDKIEQRNFVASIQRATSLLGWKPAITLNEGIGKLISASLDGFIND